MFITDGANHSTPRKINLQQFAGDDDVILPDDFEPTEPTTPSEPVEPSEPTEPVEPGTPPNEPVKTTEPTEPVQDTPKVKIKYNSEEKELSLEEAATLAQKGLNYEKAVERARQEARDQWVAEQGWTWDGKPITTEAEYKQALIEQELMNKYKDNVPEEVLKELIENRKFREESKREKEADAQAKAEAEQKAKQEADYLQFFKYFKQVHGREYDPEKDQIPAPVLEAHGKGEPLRYAYMEWHNNDLQNKLKVTEQNEKNTKTAPVKGVTTHGSTEVDAEDEFLQGFNSI